MGWRPLSPHWVFRAALLQINSLWTRPTYARIQAALHPYTVFSQHCTTALNSGSIAPLHCIQAALLATLHCIQAALLHYTVFRQHCTTALYAGIIAPQYTVFRPHCLTTALYSGSIVQPHCTEFQKHCITTFWSNGVKHFCYCNFLYKKGCYITYYTEFCSIDVRKCVYSSNCLERCLESEKRRQNKRHINNYRSGELISFYPCSQYPI